MNANEVRYYVGQPVYQRNGRFYGRVKEVLDPAGRDPGMLIVRLHRAAYTTSDHRDDAGIIAGTRCEEEAISRVQIADDPACQVATYHVLPRDGDEAVHCCDQGHEWTGSSVVCPKCRGRAV